MAYRIFVSSTETGGLFASTEIPSKKQARRIHSLLSKNKPTQNDFDLIKSYFGDVLEYIEGSKKGISFIQRVENV